MKKIFTLLLLFIFFYSNAQTFPWAKSGIGSLTDEGFTACTDGAGNVFITGLFKSPTVIFGTYTLTNAGTNNNVFIVKYDANGNVLWAKSAGSTGYDTGTSISCDPSGNVFLTGYFTSPAIIFGTYTLTNTGSYNAFLTKYDTNGNVLWAKSNIGTGNDLSNSVSTDALGNAFITGYYSSPSAVFGTYTLTNTGSQNVFLVKYDPTGNVLWAQTSNGLSNIQSLSVSADALGNTFITGRLLAPSKSFGTFTLTNAGNSDVFLAKYDTNGNVQWAQNFLGNGNDNGNGVNADAGGNVYITGSYSYTMAVGSITLTSAGAGAAINVFIAKCNAIGNVLWAKTAGGPVGTGPYAIVGDRGYSVCSFANGVYCCGGFYTPAFSIGTFTLTHPPGSIDPMFIAKYDVNGNVICASALSSGGDDQSTICADQFGNAFITGDFMTNPFIVGTNTLTLGGGENIFVAKYVSCPDPFSVNTLNENLSEINLFPNPNNGTFKLKLDNEIENGELILFNVIGQKVFSQKIKQGDNEIKTQELAKGLYHYSILQNKTQLQTGKIVIE